MIIEFLAHAAFRLVSSAGTRLVLDPYESGGFSGRVGFRPIEGPCDGVVITHDHLDHCFTGSLTPPFEVVRTAGRVVEVEIRSVSAFHDQEQGRRFGGSIDMKVLTLDGMTLCHAGDLGQRLTPSQLEALGPIDVLLLPVGGFYTLDAEDAHFVAQQLEPRVVIPCHYKSRSCGFDIAPREPFVERFERVLAVPAGAYDLALGTLPEALTCVTLEPSLD
ncbi:MAG: hypothetical protein AUK47_08665 [Deltaproteobacteria bacterium CG2_30_63_29]|nr:MAG: hypothetical protein AUK47_08665 [Deltaproteobacteria bacterium CG2_30_63_29]PIV98126.1 MAG: MBL fold metallo-hydrolase [Deltaproteobacteria bacterium CG17_big_fil_post_rev_8_21_14_2_50_63_7]PJB46803.1 MAG: MBL fold metallo-hydrolase [Deltaproteobacteria bacterium CG_4_9_14_3_um_filter_63_12]